MEWFKRIFFKCKLAYLRIRYMTCLTKVLEILAKNAHYKITKDEEVLILLLCNLKNDAYYIAHIIIGLRNRATLIQRLAALGIPESALTEDELEWIAAILSNTEVSIDLVVTELQAARSNNRKLKGPNTMR